MIHNRKIGMLRIRVHICTQVYIFICEILIL